MKITGRGNGDTTERWGDAARRPSREAQSDAVGGSKVQGTECGVGGIGVECLAERGSEAGSARLSTARVAEGLGERAEIVCQRAVVSSRSLLPTPHLLLRRPLPLLLIASHFMFLNDPPRLPRNEPIPPSAPRLLVLRDRLRKRRAERVFRAEVLQCRKQGGGGEMQRARGDGERGGDEGQLGAAGVGGGGGGGGVAVQ